MARACALALTLALSTFAGGVAMSTPPPATSASAGQVTPARVTPARATPARATPAEISSYAAREQRAPAELAKFEGGARLVIGGSVLVLVLVVIILVLVF